VNAIWRALLQGCDDGTYFDRDGDLLVVDGCLNLPRVAQELQQRLAVINNKGSRTEAERGLEAQSISGCGAARPTSGALASDPVAVPTNPKGAR
jgi:hypothetical protein